MVYSIVLSLPSKDVTLSDLSELKECGTFTCDDVRVDYSVKDIKNIKLYELTASGKGKCFISLCGKGPEQFYSFDGISDGGFIAH